MPVRDRGASAPASIYLGPTQRELLPAPQGISLQPSVGTASSSPPASAASAFFNDRVFIVLLSRFTLSRLPRRQSDGRPRLH